MLPDGENSEAYCPFIVPLPKDFTWEELIKVLNYYEYIEVIPGKTSGSRRRFIDSEKRIITLHKPHPGKILKLYQLKEIIKHLIETRKINE